MTRSTSSSRDGGTATSEAYAASLQPIAAAEIPEAHPVRVLDGLYHKALERCEGQHLPDFVDLLKLTGRDLLEYGLVVCPVRGDPFIDFLVIRKGTRIPGAELAGFLPGERYSHNIVPEMLDERLMELASCLALKQSRLSLTVSARKSTLNVKVYRAVYPVWDRTLMQHVVLIAIAPVYVAVAATAASPV